jgi:predicted ATPase
MKITRLVLKNWRNFRQVDIPLSERTYLIGPNASGKSNLLDVFRFLRDVAKREGGGLQKAVADRNGITKIRCLQARKDPEIRIELHLGSELEGESEWVYVLGFKSEGQGAQRPVVTEERVIRFGHPVLARPSPEDKSDRERLTQTHLEQINTNRTFRELAAAFQATTYLHLVPQLLKFGDQIGGNRLEHDPFGQGFLERIAKTPLRTRDVRFRKIQQVLERAVPFFKELRFKQDELTGRPHLEARYEHWRPQGAWHREEELSDGTLRLIGLLWSLLEGDGLLLLEEPELSLNDAIVTQLPLMVDRILRLAKQKRQVFISTHSYALLSNPLDGRGVLRLEPGTDGTQVCLPDAEEERLLLNGLSPADVLLPKTRPEQMVLTGLFE